MSILRSISEKSDENNPKENLLNTDLLGKIQPNSYFKLVRKTVHDLKEKRSNYNVRPGFVLIINAGVMSEVADPFSELVQTVKTVDENTAGDTLIAVAGACPTHPACNLKIPYFAKGTTTLIKSVCLVVLVLNIPIFLQVVTANI